MKPFDSAPVPPRQTFRLRLRSGKHDWRFVYTDGDESRIIETITLMARDPACPLDWSAASRLLRAISIPSDRTARPSLSAE